jgi:DNA-binding response OmpR family regulator
MGADDVIKKLVRPRELLARISNKIRRVDESKTKATHLSVGDVDLNLERFECRIQSKLVTFSVLEFNLFRYFVENVNRVLSRELILKSVWGETAIADRKVDTHMTSLRKKIRNSSLEFSTLYGAGYILKTKEREPSVSP